MHPTSLLVVLFGVGVRAQMTDMAVMTDAGVPVPTDIPIANSVTETGNSRIAIPDPMPSDILVDVAPEQSGYTSGMPLGSVNMPAVTPVVTATPTEPMQQMPMPTSNSTIITKVITAKKSTTATASASGTNIPIQTGESTSMGVSFTMVSLALAGVLGFFALA